ncbi:hypothetical protein DM02DRAFT_516773 [Periconia macrospinosa]|uniref:Zn(2)-C6 fungal-type domain-containing protein n=1 Tax=Periconia macrospinosa TaxID=97972 RepID=A0A2V1E489_9PLEO|nr:hypothetical protein DM02DRAFT_516773 [Periconia macrospinosa]
MSQRAGHGANKASRQCWECVKRRLVCDFTLPHCRKCTKNGKECPGYGEQKPVQWVQVGKVTSRRRRKESPSTAQLNAKIRTQSSSPGAASLADDSAENSEYIRKLADEFDNVIFKYRLDANVQKVFSNTSRRAIEKALAGRKRGRIINSPGAAVDPLDRLALALKVMDMEKLPAYELRSETSEVVESIEYFNMRILPQIKTADELVPNPHLTIFPVAALHLLPPEIHHTVVCLSLAHYTFSLPPAESRVMAATSTTKILHHRGAALREISHRLTTQKPTDTTMVSVCMLMCCELQQTGIVKWRQHADGLMRLVQMQGGLMNVYYTGLHLRPTITIFVYVVIFANCCTPASDQMLLNPFMNEHIVNIETMYNEIFPYCLTPPDLFKEIVRIHYLRHEASLALQTGKDTTDILASAHEILARICEFSAKDWAQPGPNYDDWLTIGEVYRSAVAVYCIMAFQALDIFPKSAEMDAELSVYADSLLVRLEVAVKVPRLQKYLAFGLLVAGVEAGYRSEAVRAWIERALLDLSIKAGAYCPLRMSTTLRKYWDRGEIGWEACFTTAEGFMF